MFTALECEMGSGSETLPIIPPSSSLSSEKVREPRMDSPTAPYGALRCPTAPYGVTRTKWADEDVYNQDTGVWGAMLLPEIPDFPALHAAVQEPRRRRRQREPKKIRMQRQKMQSCSAGSGGGPGLL